MGLGRGVRGYKFDNSAILFVRDIRSFVSHIYATQNVSMATRDFAKNVALGKLFQVADYVRYND